MPTYNDGVPVSPPSVTMMASYTEFTEEVGDYLGIGRDTWSTIEETRINSIVRSGLLQVYYPQIKEGIAHQWSFMRPEAIITTTAAYDTGSVEVATGVVTLTGGTFPAWAAQGELNVGSQVYTVNTRDSDTQVTLDDTSVTVAAGTSYSLTRPSYELPIGFDGNFDGNLNYKTGNNSLWGPIKFVSPANIRTLKQNYNGADRPLFAAVQPTTNDATEGTRWQIVFHPTPNAVWTLHGRYKVRPEMIDNSDLYPLGGTAMSEVFMESCLAVAEKRFVEDQDIHQKEFARLLAQAIAHDADAFSADFLGYNRDRSDRRHSVDDDHMFNDNAIHSYEGVVYYD
jgi:hypothetical protein